MVQSYDVGSLPFEGDLEKLLIKGNYFEEKVIQGFIDKLKAGINIPNYPQFRDMNEMFLESINGIKKERGSYIITDNISIKLEKAKIAEISAIKNKSHEIYEKNDGPFKLKVCITGPYTLSSFFTYKWDEIFNELGNIVFKIVESNIFKNKYGKVEIIAIDEPVLGLLNDPLMDYGSSGREILLKSWEKIFYKAKSKKTKTCIHLHSTSNEMFWEIKSLDIIESHMDDLLYCSKKTKKLLEEKDKFLKASIDITDFDKLIERKISKTNKSITSQEIADAWTKIKKGKINPIVFLESVEKMKERLEDIINRFGKERVPYAGLECGLKSFPTYNSAIEYLKKSSEAISLF